MIRISGSTEGPERQAAELLATMAREAWPWADDDPSARLEFVVGVQLHNQTTRDLDVVLFARLPIERTRFTPYLNVSVGGKWLRPGAAAVADLALVIEVKDQDPSGVRFEGTRAEVLYHEPTGPRWSGATEQGRRQIFALKRYLQGAGIVPPFLTSLIWLRQIAQPYLPPRPHNLLPERLHWEMLLNVVAQLGAARWEGDTPVLRAWGEGPPPAFDRAVRLLTQRVEPTRLDRMRMDRLSAQAVRQEWEDALQSRQLLFRGRGGTGKTMLLLQLAVRQVARLGRRVLLLTYNQALAADLRRLMTLAGVADAAEGRGIQVQTVHGFLGSVFRGLKLLGPDDDLIDQYGPLKAETLAMLNQGALTEQDLDALRRSDAFGWDLLFLDEAQDWPEDERDLLRRLHPPSHFAVADGVDQFVRGQAACDWQSGLAPGQTLLVPLASCLRMKANLATFANALASQLMLPGWSVEANPDAPGGNVIVAVGDYFAATLHATLLERNVADGNQPVDMLACVPPSLAPTVALGFAQLGQEVWDGTSAEGRAAYPTSARQFRVVQYDSCRGLEGWVVLALAIDEFFQYKLDTYRPGAGDLLDDPDARLRFAARWLMIPISRAIDTLVLTVSDKPSPLRDALRQVAARYTDFVSWQEISPPPRG
jgi:hypothetical protein